MALSYGKKDKVAGFEKAEETEKGLVSMENDDDDKLDYGTAYPTIDNDFPYGLRLSLDERDLAKLKLDAKDATVGDYLNFRARACVKHKMESESEGGKKCCRIELQIEQMGLEGKDE